MSDDAFDRPVPSFDEHIGPTFDYPRQGGIFVEPGHQIDSGQRSDQRQAVDQAINRPIVSFAESFYRRITIQRNHQRRTQCPRLRQ